MVFQMADERKKILQQAQNDNNNNNPIPPPFDVMVLHYEDYEKDFSKTMHRLLDFLEQPAQAEPREFSPGHEYNTYYSKKDKQHIQTMIQRMASPTTWDALKHYF
eukprot:CAMPEP_0202444870 /NCGR_PEP_ID=MMETSP1360-20130828/3795_1 /ASSEMBLY_ACC=CAM_ASM_000848 /TAXON_ID=515479 /ORGANISM="Licmophora paradoxa, Strain CCMP2313" /LENGTH=104 /DNA_ID=CAMNT_0049060961 /DNA_START=403 /DNA_END=717 /DNA_ORIENTATION=+